MSVKGNKTKSIKIGVIDLAGEEKSRLVLPSAVFAAKVNPALMAQAVRVYLSNQRRAFAKTKTRGETSGSGRKIWRQKGTGRARHGDRYAPIFVGGGRAHGPRGNRNYRLGLSKKMKRAALCSALTVKFQKKEILVVDGFRKIEPKTKIAKKVFLQILKKNFDEKKKYLVVLPDRWEATKRAFRNLPYVNFSLANSLNTYLILKHQCLIFAPEAIKKIVRNG